jgi:hypothetical protein
LYPREVIERKVENHYSVNRVLKERWGIDITDQMLGKELDRIKRSSRMPQRLQALLGVLGNDRHVIQESLVRPILADRLARLAYAGDAELHAPARRKAETIREDLVRGAIDPYEDHPRRAVLQLNSDTTSGPRSIYSLLDASLSGMDARPIEASWLEPVLFDTWPSLMGAPNRSVGEIRETVRAFLVPVVLNRVLDGVELAVFAVEKEPWEDWWASAQHQCCAHFPLDLRGAVGRTSKHQAFEQSRLGRSTPHGENKGGISLGDSTPACGQDDTWSALATAANSPSAREIHTSVWTGTEMIVWGGIFRVGDTISLLGDGARYDPMLDIWMPTATTGAPTARWLHAAVWAGDSMIVWGGDSINGTEDTGARYDPVSDSWTATSIVDAPSSRELPTAVWTGAVMLVWGGGTTSEHRIGGRYDPTTDTWASTALSLSPTERIFHSAVWTGTHMLIWGGEERFGGELLDTGRLYDPVSDTWSVMSTTNVPAARSRHTAVWTGDRMIVWGGLSASITDSGGQYDPIADSWVPTSSTNAPAPRFLHTAVWIESTMLVWGGAADLLAFSLLDSGGRYDPSGDLWTPTSMTDAPARRMLHTVISAGEFMLVWGGQSAQTVSLDDGGAYCSCTQVEFFADTDGDGFGDDSTMISSCSAPQGYVLNNGDCDDSNGTVWSVPSEVNGLLLPDPSTLTWAPPSSPGGTQPLYDVLRTSDPADFMTAATCVSSDDPLTSTTDAQDPALGAAFFYDIRAETGCPGGGQGPLGSDSNGIPRMGRSCP